ncbi:MAG TPA: hypothetical protein VGS03_15870 [Candidatus Polarisedimenticolia bacterium]|jgi:hypothetical protein|nr:hypothetical protein [Candidatus Polarisedimenticolia bacterium]
MIITSLSRPAHDSAASSRRRGALLWVLLATAPAFPGLLPGSAIAATPETKPASDAGPGVETATTEADKAAEDMARTRADLLARHQGADEARLTQLMGPPSEKGTKNPGLTLTWRGPAGDGVPACRISATLVDGGLANLELSGTPSWDPRTCRKFLRPLLQALPWKTIEHPAAKTDGATVGVLANEMIVQMMRDGLPSQAILARIRTQPCRFDVSAQGTRALRRNNVPEPLIQAMADRVCG